MRSWLTVTSYLSDLVIAVRFRLSSAPSHLLVSREFCLIAFEGQVRFCAASRLPSERVIFAAIPGPGIENIYDLFEFFAQFWNRSLKHAL